ncbi:signal peptide peptidase SppA [uncultured Alistipes sp.]|uniref:signal peptide peptidase SppA n=3 Tax=uncultured Alistipes sp. TaxID=538949 RepID=UPI00261BEE17|nr:signal peptide peptidase SppA [uncultured Alistipes sp.]
MNSFFRTFLACLLAFVVANILIGTFFVMVLAGIGAAFSEQAPAVESGSVLRIDLSERITDAPSVNPFSSMGLADLIDMDMSRSYALVDVLEAIERAASDDDIEGIYLNINPYVGVGMATLDEIRDAVVKFKESGKFVLSYADYYTQGSYYLATAADRIYMNPEGSLSWAGMATGVMFYKDLLEKLDIRAEVIRHGKYKAAVEPFLLDKMSPENRLQTERLLGSMWGYVVGNIAEARGLDSAELQRYASELTLSDARSAVETSMVDSLAYEADMQDMLCEMTGWDDEPEFVSLGTYIDQPRVATKKLSKNKIAVVYAEGQIVDGKAKEGLVGGNSLAARLRDVRRDEGVRAVVLRVNSPGGSALASEVIWHEIEQIRKDRPVIVSMGNMAASGGYYISCPADAIVASPLTLTGSIGVFGLMFDGSAALKNKLGITVDVAKTNPSADMGMSVFGAVGVRPLSPAERAFMQNSVEEVYTTFVNHVAQGRNLSVETVDSLGGGRVWSGMDAVQIGLADGFGGLKDAIALAADRAGVADDFRVVTPQEEPDRFTQIMKLMSAESRAELFAGEFGRAYAELETLRNLFARPGVQAMTTLSVELR